MKLHFPVFKRYMYEERRKSLNEQGGYEQTMSQDSEDSPLDLFSLKDRVVLLTGASGGIGKTLALGLARAGAVLALTDHVCDSLITLQQQIEEIEGQADVFIADLSQQTTIPALVDSVLNRYQRVDVLINCAGINKRTPIEEVTGEVYESIMAVNLRSAYFLSQAVVKHMVDSKKGGKIIHIGSINASTALAQVSVYAMAKAALAQATKNMAVEWAKHNIQVNCLSPGFITTPLSLPLWNDPRKKQWILDRVPQKRLGSPKELLGATIYLASQASSYMTGQTMYIDGGFLAGSEW